jgi:hypothetical protein
MKTPTPRVCSSFARPLRRGIPILLISLSLLLIANEAGARGFVAYRGGGGRGFVAAGGGGRGFVAAGRGYGGGYAVRGYGYGGVRYGAVGYAGGIHAGYLRTIPAGYRRIWYGGYNCYYAGGVYYRPEFYQGSTVYVVVNP